MTTLRHRLSVPLMISKIEERQTCTGAHKAGTDTVFHWKPDGWWITFTNGVSFGVGEEKPAFSEGDIVILSLIQAPTHGNSQQSPPVKPVEPTGEAWPDNNAPVRQLLDPSAPLNFTPGSEREREDT